MPFIKNLIASTYTFRMKISKITGMGINTEENKNNIKATVDFYSLKQQQIRVKKYYFKSFQAKKYYL